MTQKNQCTQAYQFKITLKHANPLGLPPQSMALVRQRIVVGTGVIKVFL